MNRSNKAYNILRWCMLTLKWLDTLYHIDWMFPDYRWGGWVRQRCRESYVTGSFNWDWLTVGQGLLFLQEVRVEGECFYFFCFFTSFIFLFLPCPSFSPPLLSLLSLFSLFLGDYTEWPKRFDLSLIPNTINQWQITGSVQMLGTNATILWLCLSCFPCIA